MALESLRETVYETLMALPENDLVRGTSGNVSGREGDRVVIKPSGVDYDELAPENLVVVDMDGAVVEGDLKPSVDTGAHLHIYRANDELGGIIHTHSTYATAFAAAGRELPVYVTELADTFGESIPVSEYVPPGTEAIGEEFAKHTGEGKFQGLLMKNHGLFAAGDTPGDALKAALHIEHSAKISSIAEDLGTPEEIPPEEAERLNQEYLEGYGQE
ncbi:class II aldolase/adducin family protein [Halorhabdus tiamatea]|uniref:L-ribulose-5-phosphate 4-epimerase n=1 Tax=Halorhabdus tiamatea SARL4B TaxID=1033806 RepID=F7PM78_9EURY|nr:class II aldolase/adducin family protein [Halorhabdus tiamatea]CCQ33179.1 L-ribulose-5-phosphate 4-epimerase [Halorhabdus tiamatea SARL4B]